MSDRNRKIFPVLRHGVIIDVSTVVRTFPERGLLAGANKVTDFGPSVFSRTLC